MQRNLISVVLALFVLCFESALAKAELKPGDAAPLFSLAMHDGKTFSLDDRLGKGWTVLYFYPKSQTPGCTKQACAFRDAILKIKALNAEVYGISADSIENQAAFHKQYQLKFPLLADPEGTAIELYGARVPLLGIAKRWTFIIDPKLKVAAIEKDVDPAMDAERVSSTLVALQAAYSKE
jgi:peroxiredoxin Q/BCP